MPPSPLCASGCPSDRVAGAGCFGASMMLRPELVAACCAAMAQAVASTRITVKCRIGESLASQPASPRASGISLPLPSRCPAMTQLI